MTESTLLRSPDPSEQCGVLREVSGHTWVEWVWDGSCKCGSTHLRLPDLVVPAIHLQLPQQGSNGLPAGLDILGQEHLELLREVLAQVGKDSVSTVGGCSYFMSRARFPLLVLVLQVLGPVPCELGTAGPHLQTYFLKLKLGFLCVCAVLMEGSRESQIPWSGVTDDYEPLYVGVWIPSWVLCKPNLCSSC